MTTATTKTMTTTINDDDDNDGEEDDDDNDEDDTENNKDRPHGTQSRGTLSASLTAKPLIAALPKRQECFKCKA